VWDVTKVGPPAPRSGELKPRDVESRWADLASDDAAKGFEAICALAAAPGAAVPFFKENLKPASVDATRIERLIADLDSDRFEARQGASSDLEKMGELAVPLLCKALDGKPSLETARRIQELLDRAEGGSGTLSGDRLRSLRVVEVLEKMGTPEARQLLQDLAKGAPGALLTRAAQAALDRPGR
jgi:hypothetical protein